MDYQSNRKAAQEQYKKKRQGGQITRWMDEVENFAGVTWNRRAADRLMEKLGPLSYSELIASDDDSSSSSSNSSIITALH